MLLLRRLKGIEVEVEICGWEVYEGRGEVMARMMICYAT